MTHASLFTGIGGFDLGFELAGHETVFQCENDKACREVLEYHWPEVRRHDDIRTLDGRELRGVGLISGGFPCQDLSVAGKREGLSGSHSGLFFELVRVVDEARPDYLVFENVPGLCSSSGGKDFRTVLGTLADISYFGAVRLLDSQFLGVAQRRRRVFGVFARGDSGWRRAGAVLFDEPGGRWNPAKGRKAGKDIAHSLDSGAGGVSAKENQRTLALNSRSNRYDGESQTFVAQPVTHNPYDDRDAAYGAGRLVAAPLRDNMRNESNPTEGRLAFCLRPDPGGTGQGHNTTYISGTLGQWSGGPCPERVDQCTVSPPPDPDGMREVAGLPRGMDSRRYRQLGNAVTVNVAYWLGKRIANVEEMVA